MTPELHDPGNRRLAWLTSPEVDAIPKQHAVVIQPIGATEQHGPHMACCIDAMIADTLAVRAVARCGVDVEVWLLPVQSYGRSGEHTGFAGTVSLDTTTLSLVCRDIGRSAAASGFRKLAFVNGHGGQPQLLETSARDIRAETGLQVFPLNPYQFLAQSDISMPDGDAHAGYLETSIAMAIDPGLVRSDKLAAGGAELREAYANTKYLTFEGGAAPTAWLTRDVSPNGVIGDAAGGER